MVVASLLVTAAVGVAVGPAGAQSAPRPVSELETIDPVLDAVPVRGSGDTSAADRRLSDARLAESRATDALAESRQARLDLIERSRQADRAVADADADVQASQQELDAQGAELAVRQTATGRARDVLARERKTLRVLVSAVFTSQPTETPLVGTFAEMTTGQRQQDVRDRTVDIQSDIVTGRAATLAAAQEAEQAQRDRVGVAAEGRRRADAARADAVSARDDAVRLVAASEVSVTAHEEALTAAADARHRAFLARRDVRFTAPVAGVDLSLVDLHAYWLASATAPCAIPWWVMAGIGAVESGHGTAQGSQVEANGTTSVRILGVPLDGRPGVAAIADTDGGLLDLDRQWDRAVGPMQFIPGTWARWGRDGNGDGAADPHNLYDAAAAAANYLCFGRASVTDDNDIRAALLSYNHSDPYGARVMAIGHRYQASLGLPDLAPADTNSVVATVSDP